MIRINADALATRDCSARRGERSDSAGLLQRFSDCSSAATRARSEGCEAKKNSYHAGGSSSAIFWIAQPPERGRAAGRVMGGCQRESIGSPFARARECEEQRTQHLRRGEHHRIDAHDAERTAPQLLALGAAALAIRKSVVLKSSPIAMRRHVSLCT